MRIVRFTAPVEIGVGSDPLFGVLNDKDSILVLRGDPIYSGIIPQDKSLKLSDVKLLAPVLPRSKVVCIGKNYADHAAEMDSVVPSEPIIFIKPNTSVIGPNEVIIWPKMSERVDHEAELAVVPSLYEGFSLPAIEAMATGTCLVATTGGALPEVTGVDNDTVLSCPAGDAEALAAAIRRGLDSKELRDRIGAAGRARVVERWSWRHCAALTVDQYKEVLSMPHNVKKLQRRDSK